MFFVQEDTVNFFSYAILVFCLHHELGRVHFRSSSGVLGTFIGELF